MILDFGFWILDCDGGDSSGCEEQLRPRSIQNPKSKIQNSARSAFTLLEMLVTVAVIAVATVILMPDLRDDSRLRLTAASSVLISDIELAQVMTIAQPNIPVVVCFEEDGSGYWLAYQNDPGMPMTRPDNGQPYEVKFGAGRGSSAADVRVNLENVPDRTLLFNPQGGMDDFTLTPRIELSHHDRAITITIAPTTGSLSEQDGGL